MTRFNISIENAVEMVIHALDKGVGGELFVPKLKSYNIMDLANAFDQSITKKIVGIRPGEKIHEEMITFSDSMNSYDCGKYFIIMPPNLDIEHEKKFLETYEGEISKIEEPFSYNSGENTQWESTQTLNELIKNYKQNYHE
jgi:FlaA1/EpsC-like NDP-sugar epimerase